MSRRVGLGEGAVIAGRVAARLDGAALARLAADRQVVLVTGTNGKTTTAHLLAAALRTRGPVAHNDAGANMADGALAALMRRPRAPVAVLEVDELHVPRVAAAVSPAVVVLLNLTRDQLDRSTEVTAVAAELRRALATQPGALVIANCDDPVVAAAVDGLPRVCWVAAGANWTQDAALCPRCGQPLTRAVGTWSCRACGTDRPAPSWRLEDDRAIGPDTTTRLRLELPGAYNRGNALAALAAADALGIEPARAAGAMRELRAVAGRYAVVRHGHHRLRLLLAKNPAGWRETLPLAATAAGLLLAVNAAEADGRDTSWLWDIGFERLPDRPTVASGQAAADLGLCLSYAGVEHTTVPDPLRALAGLPAGEVVVIANYTAFAELRSRLARSRPR